MVRRGRSSAASTSRPISRTRPSPRFTRQLHCCPSNPARTSLSGLYSRQKETARVRPPSAKLPPNLPVPPSAGNAPPSRWKAASSCLSREKYLRPSRSSSPPCRPTPPRPMLTHSSPRPSHNRAETRRPHSNAARRPSCHIPQSAPWEDRCHSLIFAPHCARNYTRPTNLPHNRTTNYYQELRLRWSRRTFLSSLSRTALVLKFDDVLALAQPQSAMGAKAGGQFGAQSS